MPLENLENHLGQILIGICRHGGAGSNRIAKALMQRSPPAGIVLRLFSDEFLHARSSRVKIKLFFSINKIYQFLFI